MFCEKCSGKGLCPVKFGIALGLTCALFMALAAWLAGSWGYAKSMVDMYGAMYHGYDASFEGGLWGILWGFIKGFVFGFVLISFYHLVKRCCSKSCQCTCGTSGNMQRK